MRLPRTPLLGSRLLLAGAVVAGALHHATAQEAPVREAPAASAAAAPRPARVVRIELTGTIDVSSADFLERALKHAEEVRAAALVVELNTPGGLLDPMEKMVRLLLGARVPTVVYVSPAGGHAWSAGALVTMAAAVAAMHPATTIGAAHPVSLFPGNKRQQDRPHGERAAGPASAPSLLSPASQAAEGASRLDAPSPAGPPAPPGSQPPELQKVLNAVTEQARAIARARGRSEEMAVRFVRESATLAAREALEARVVDFLAADVDDLLRQIDGRQVTAGSRVITLATSNATVATIKPSTRERFLHLLSSPNLLMILLAVGTLGLFFEIQTPGAIFPGVVGGIALLLALYSLSVLPVSWAGLGLLLLGLLLFILDLKYPSHGVLTIGGVVAFVLGAVFLIDTPLAPALSVSWYVILGIAFTMAAFFLFAVGAVARAHQRPVGTGAEGLLGARGTARTALAPKGTVQILGELWQARATGDTIEQGTAVEVTAVERLTLVVRACPAAPTTPSPSEAPDE